LAPAADFALAFLLLLLVLLLLLLQTTSYLCRDRDPQTGR
jgi:uncharacterized protein (UPF0333 family)